MFRLRLASISDVKEISKLIKLSARVLGIKFYSSNTIEAALKGAFGVDTQLLHDQTYYVVEDEDQALLACGGWSYRKTLFGSDENNFRNPAELDPETDAAKIRAFFIHPNFTRQGLGKIILQKGEEKARLKGFTKLELMATLPGVDFYQKHSYRGESYILHYMTPSDSIQFLQMSKLLLFS